MLKRSAAARLALIYLHFLSSVTGDEGSPGNNFSYDNLPYFISTLKEMCLERLDPLSCQYWDKITDYESPNAFRTKQQPTENRTSGREIPKEAFQEEIDIPFVNIENNQQKRFSVFRRKNPTARGYKRGPGFRSWGGKRDLIPSEQNKRSKFASWGGKRDEEVFPEDFFISDNEAVAEKRQKFQNWGGKRSNDFLEYEGKSPMASSQMNKRSPIWKNSGYYLSEPFKKHVPKRPQFQSWGGKRGTYPWRELLQLYRSQNRFLLNGGEKRKFSSWGGKRYDELENLYGNSHWEDKPTENSKRHVFQNWGGKRTNSDGDSLTLKESELNENAKERSKREVEENEQNQILPLNYNSWGAEQEENKNTR